MTDAKARARGYVGSFPTGDGNDSGTSQIRGGPRTLYLFKTGRRERLQGTDSFPTELFYGYCQLRELGRNVDMLDEADIKLLAGHHGYVMRLATRALVWMFPRFPVALPYALILARRPIRERLNACRTVVATTQTFGFCLGLLKRLGFVKARVAFIVMGTFPDSLPLLYRGFVRWLLGACDLVTISESETRHLKQCLGEHPALHSVPFGVDTTFWTPAASARPRAVEDYVLSIGNDRHRDYRTLLAIWQPHFPRLRIVTRLPVTTCHTNVEIIAGDWRERIHSDAEIRNMIHDCRFVVLPIQDTIQPSGQSACLQAMACAKAVVLSDFRGLWDRNVMRDGETCLLVPSGDAEALQRAIERLLSSSDLVRRIGINARHAVESSPDIGVMADAMARIFAMPVRAA